MSNAVIGALRVTLGLDSAQFSSGLKSAQTGLQNFAGMARTGALAVASAMLAAGTAVGISMKGIIDDADKMSKMSQSIGIPIEELSKLRYAAELADIDLDKLEKSVRRLSASMVDAAESGTSTAARAFSMLGVSVKDAEGKMRPATAVVEDLAARFARMPDGVTKTALAMRIFGKSGADMIPLLNEGSEGLRELYAEAEQLGLVLDTETGKAAEAFNDNLTRMGKIKDGIVTKITAAMLPAFANLSDAMVVSAKNAQGLSAAGQALGWVIKTLATAAVTAGGFFVWMAQGVGMAAEATANWATNPAKAVAALAVGQERMKATMATTREMNRAIWAPFTGGLDEPPAVGAMEDIEVASTGARRAVARLTDEEREAQRAAEEMAREAANIFEQTLNPAEQYIAQVLRLDRMLAAAAISQETFNRAMEQARKNFEENDPVAQSRQSIEDKRRQFQQDSAEETMALADEHQANLEAATYDGIRGGLEAAADGNLGEYLAARLRSALFDGLANSLTNLFTGGGKGGGGGIFGSLDSLKSMGSSLGGLLNGLPGFKTGGSFKVGGAGGPDSQLTAFRSTPGEMVDIRRPGQDKGSAQAVHVIPSPYFDVVVADKADASAARAGFQAVGVARQVAPSDAARRSRFNLLKGS